MFWEKRKPLRRCSSQMKPQLKGSPFPALPASDLHKYIYFEVNQNLITWINEVFWHTMLSNIHKWTKINQLRKKTPWTILEPWGTLSPEVFLVSTNITTLAVHSEKAFPRGLAQHPACAPHVTSKKFHPVTPPTILTPLWPSDPGLPQGAPTTPIFVLSTTISCSNAKSVHNAYKVWSVVKARKVWKSKTTPQCLHSFWKKTFYV